MEKDFLEVFLGLEVEKELKALLEDVKVTKIAVNPKKDRMRVYIQSIQWIQKKYIYALEKQIKKQFFASAQIQIKIIEKFTLTSQYTPKLFFEAYRSSMLDELRGHSILIYNTFRTAKIEFPEENKMKLVMQSSVLAKSHEEELISYIEKIFCERCAFSLIVEPEYEEAGESKIRKNSEIRIMQEAAHVIEQSSFGHVKDEAEEGTESEANQPDTTKEEKKESKKESKKENKKEKQTESKTKKENTKEKRFTQNSEYRRGVKRSDNPDVIYTSSNPNIATVSEDGIVTGVSSGSVEIVIQAADQGGAVVSAFITVIDELLGDFPRHTWKATVSHTFVPDPAGGGSPEMLLDGSYNTFLSIRKPGKGVETPAGAKIFFTIDMGQQYPFNYFSWHHRGDNVSVGLRGSKVDIYGSLDGETFDLIQNEILLDTGADASTGEKIILDDTSSCRYVRFVITGYSTGAGSAVQISEIQIGRDK